MRCRYRLPGDLLPLHVGHLLLTPQTHLWKSFSLLCLSTSSQKSQIENEGPGSFSQISIKECIANCFPGLIEHNPLIFIPHCGTYSNSVICGCQAKMGMPPSFESSSPHRDHNAKTFLKVEEPTHSCYEIILLHAV